MQRERQYIVFFANKSLTRLAAGVKRFPELKLGIVVATILTVAGLCVAQSIEAWNSVAPINLAQRLFALSHEKNQENTERYKTVVLRKYHDAYLPAVLSDEDAKTYHAIFAAQKKADFDTADTLVTQLENQILLGHVLADRYLHRKYVTTYPELKQWLKNYADHPAADAIYQLALNKKPSGIKLGVTFTSQNTLRGYGDGHGRSSNKEDLTAKPVWQSALSAWRKGDKTTAARLFGKIADQADSLSEWDASAAAYWAYRTHASIGNHKKANYYIRLAASAPRSFYGIIARKRLGMGLNLHVESNTLSEEDIAQIYSKEGSLRAIALRESGMIELAEQELRQLFPSADATAKQRMLTLATLLDMPAVQMRMGRSLSDNAASYDYAMYPTPRWQPKSGFHVDPALVYAFARQESGFNTKAQSSAGAIGIMQLMPQTAEYIATKVAPGKKISMKALAEPEANVSLGQHYIRYLMGHKNIGNNLFFLAVAYNAGPGKLIEWQKDLKFGSDPLLFVESLPYLETRNHLKQVLTGYWIYSEIMGGESESLTDIARGQWPGYTYSSGEVASLSDF